MKDYKSKEYIKCGKCGNMRFWVSKLFVECMDCKTKHFRNEESGEWKPFVVARTYVSA